MFLPYTKHWFYPGQCDVCLPFVLLLTVWWLSAEQTRAKNNGMHAVLLVLSHISISDPENLIASNLTLGYEF